MKYGDDYYRDLAKLFGASNNPVVSADSWINIMSVPQSGVLQYADLRINGTALVTNPALIPIQCLFYGSWSIYVDNPAFALAGFCMTVGQAPIPNNTVQPYQFSTFKIASKQFAAATNPNPTPYNEIFQYYDTALINQIAFQTTGAGNVYQVTIKFDGIRVTWGGQSN